MKIKSIAIENYKSYKDDTLIDFGTPVDGNNTLLIGALNGGGKTSLVESIKIALYGETRRKILSCINRSNLSKSSLLSKFTLTLLDANNNAEIKIVRKYTSLNLKSEANIKEDLSVYIDGKNAFVDNSSAQKYISNIIPEDIIEFFIFDGEKVKNLASDKELSVLKKSYESALGISRIDTLHRQLQTLRKELLSAKSGYNEHEIDELQLELKKKRQALEDEKHRKQELILSVKEAEEKFKDQDKLFKKLLHKTLGEDSAYKDLVAQKRDIDKKLNYSVSSNNEILKDLYLILLRPYFEKLEDEITLQDSSSLNKAITKNAETISSKIIQAIEIPAPIWKEKLSHEKRAELEERVTSLLKNISKEQDGKLSQLSDSQIHILKNLISKGKSLSFDHSLPSFSNVNKFKNKLEDIDYSIINLRNDENNRAEIERASQLKEDLLTSFRDEDKALETTRELIDKIQKEVEELESKIEGLLLKQKDFKGILNKINLISKYSHVLELFKKYLREDKIHKMEEYAFSMFEKLTHRNTCREIQINPNTFEILIKDSDGAEIQKDEMSEGEKQVLAKSILWALSKASNIKFPMIIDTPLSKLDSHHRKNIVREFYKTAAEQVIVLSTDTEIVDKLYDFISEFTYKELTLTFNESKSSTEVFQNKYISII